MITNFFLDLIAIIKSISEPQNLTKRETGKEYIKTDIELIDDSNQSVS